MYSSFFLLLRFEIFDYRDREKIRRPRISKGNANVGGGGAHASSVTLQQGEKGNICVYIYIFFWEKEGEKWRRTLITASKVDGHFYDERWNNRIRSCYRIILIR